jgi:hypothetical protein
MSLLAVPPDALRDVSVHQVQPSPHGERRERFYSLAVALVLLATPLYAVLTR